MRLSAHFLPSCPCIISQRWERARDASFLLVRLPHMHCPFCLCVRYCLHRSFHSLCVRVLTLCVQSCILSKVCTALEPTCDIIARMLRIFAGQASSGDRRCVTIDHTPWDHVKKKKKVGSFRSECASIQPELKERLCLSRDGEALRMCVHRCCDVTIVCDDCACFCVPPVL